MGHAPPLRIGLTGGIGSGKSTVSRHLRDLGAAIVDTDQIARDLSASGGAAIEPIRQAFGSEAIDPAGALDRVRMRTLAFADAQVRLRLEAILHPLIARETARQAADATAPMVVFDVPLLVESGRWPARVDRVWVVDCSAQTQVERVTGRPGWDAAAVERVIAQQASRPARRAVADAVIFNDAISKAELERQVATLWRESIALAR